MNNLPLVVAQQRRGRASNPRLLDRESDALPLSHRATLMKLGTHDLCANMQKKIFEILLLKFWHILKILHCGTAAAAAELSRLTGGCDIM